MQRIFILFVLWACRTASAQIILSEVMFNPRGNENTNEFLEIFNASVAASVDLLEWRIGDQNETDLLVSPDSLYTLAPGQFALILDPGYFQSEAIYDSLVPPEALVLTIDDNTFGSGGLSNTRAETILLIDAVGDTIVRYSYSLGNPDGISDEKIILSTDDSPANWANSRRLDGTPGQRNSVAQHEIDGELIAGSFQVSPTLLREGQAATIRVVLRNIGQQTITEASVEFWIVGSNANLNLPFLLSAARLPRELINGDSVRIGMEWKNTIAGRHTIMAKLILPDDEQNANDTLVANIAIGWQHNVVRINEIMYDPAAGQTEWIEIFNPQPAVLPLADWILQDESGTRGLIPRQVTIPPLSYRVLAASPDVAKAFDIADSLVIILEKFPTLNNSSDVLLLRDFSNAVIDSVAYETDWGGRGVSAEKVWYERENLKENWRPSQDRRGATPAAFNSVSPRDIDLALVRLFFDPPGPQAGEDVYIIAEVLNRGRRTVDHFAITFAVDRNRDGEMQSNEEIGTVTVGQALAAEDSCEIRFFYSQPVSGRHRIFGTVSASLDAVPENNRIAALLSVGYNLRSVVMNEIYYAPRSGEVEWVEFYNRSSLPVDLSEWRWRDGDAELPIVLPDSDLILPPGEFALLGAGMNITQADPQAQLIVPKDWLTLNNDRERLFLADFHGRLQDSLSFTQHWGGGTGVSLERINPHLASNDSSNWSSCVDPSGSTPGKPNSILTELVPRQATVTVSPQSFSPDGDGRDDFAIIQIQVPATTATVHLKIYDVRGRLVRHLLNNAPVGSAYEVIWNGKDDTGRPIPTGIYILYLQAIHATGGVLVQARTTLVLARQLN